MIEKKRCSDMKLPCLWRQLVRSSYLVNRKTLKNLTTVQISGTIFLPVFEHFKHVEKCVT